MNGLKRLYMEEEEVVTYFLVVGSFFFGLDFAGSSMTGGMTPDFTFLILCNRVDLYNQPNRFHLPRERLNGSCATHRYMDDFMSLIVYAFPLYIGLTMRWTHKAKVVGRYTQRHVFECDGEEEKKKIREMNDSRSQQQQQQN
ncbi:hypothetical protein OUZ56_004135 [Daphnia magna]|uniref:Uncharacterized protein n=1 Tax=Daphnia magna TaxID=35525 RepID=A0ABQ9YNU3_9CRUS|nr:hypothetical protein OUZ56_004135 [Daphnia magna]